MSIKISELPVGSALSGTEEIPIVQSATTKKITAQDVADLASGGDLQQVTDNGNTTTNDLIVTDGSGEGAIIGQTIIVTQNTDNDSFASINNDGSLRLQGNGIASQLKNTNVTNSDVILEFPNKATGSYTIATTDNYVPYTGATTNVDLDDNGLDAKFIKIKGTGGNGHLNLKHQSSGSTAGGSESVIYADNSGNPKWKNDGNAVQNVMLENSAITGATKTKITYDAKGLVTAGADATTADIADSSNKRYVTDANLVVIGNTSGTNTGDQTFFNPRVQTVSSSATVTAVSTNDIVTITAQAVGLTLANPTGTFEEGQSLIIRVKDNGTARSITYGANFRAIGVTAPTTTVISKTTYIGCIYNSTDTKFDIIGVCTEA
jgi:hypothetical protein